MNSSTKLCILQLLRPVINLAKYSTHPKFVAQSSAAAKKRNEDVIKDAERVVGYPTSFLNLRWLLNDEIANIANHLGKLMDLDHPLIDTAKDMVFKKGSDTWGLMVLLISKTAGVANHSNDFEYDKVAGILHNQRVLAEVTEMIRNSVKIHRGVLNLPEGNSAEVHRELHFGNKLALLSGDYLLAKCMGDLALIKNHEVNVLMSSTLRDLTESDFLGERDAQNYPLPSKPLQGTRCKEDPIDDLDLGPYNVEEILGNPKSEWFLRSTLTGANLLAKSCKGAMMLSQQCEQLQNASYRFGRNVALAWQMREDLEHFLRKEFNKNSLVGAPIMWCLDQHPELYEVAIEPCKENVSNCDFNSIYRFIMNRNDVLSECTELQNLLAQKALDNLYDFDESPSKSALVKLVNSIVL